MGKSFGDRNRKKGAERAYRRTKKSDRRTGPNQHREDWYGADRKESWQDKPVDRGSQS